ncbi:hypothetical protein NW764_013732 [Fusarium oxysporum]|nr:hypothetical protein NW764_013732 [Fusarium oxysporum]
MKKDRERLRTILEEEDDISKTSQTDLYGRNILHLCTNWPDGLRLLLQRQDVRPLIDSNSRALVYPLSPLDHALFYSKTCCNAPDQWTHCDNCSCYATVQLLLEADCSVTVGQERPETLAGCSLKARKLFFKHLKDRRERLRNLALRILPEEFLSQYGVTANFLPDKTAPFLWNELQEAKEQRDQLPVDLTDSLKPYSGNLFIKSKSFFDFPHHLQVAELALDYGLAPKDERGAPTLWSSIDIMRSESDMPQQGPMQNSMSVLIGNVYPTFGTYLTRNALISDREEEWKEILDEDRELIDQLQALDEEFGDAFDRQNVRIGEFLRGYWLTRMKEVIADLNKPLDDDDRYDLWEAGVVLEEDDADGSGCCIGYTEDEL